MFYCLYETSIKKSYKNSAFSIAAFVNSILILIVVILPFVLSYYSQGFWFKSIECLEQPNITFKKDLLFEVETSHGKRSWSSSNFYKNKIKSLIKRPFITFSEKDENFDKINDEFSFHLKVPLNNESLHGITLLLVFSYNLKCMSNVKLEGLALIQFNHWKSLSSLSIYGDLKLVQNINFFTNKENTELNYSILPHSSQKISDWKIQNILKNYWRRKATTRYFIQYMKKT
ncbi:Transmembrane protein [Armadillidium vulgare]|nr:Transmembrane protein [Armadillidium vulgare]